MKKITFNTVQKWIKASKKPLKDEVLELFQQDFFGDFRHEYYRFFYHMVAEMKPKIALEIGIDHGHTVAHMAAGNPGTLAIGIDRRGGCAKNIPIFSNARIIYANSLECEDAISSIVAKHGQIGIVFQDSSHHYGESKQEFYLYSKFLTKNAIWVCDDVTPDFHDPINDPPGKSMVEYFNELPGRKKTYENLHYGTAMGVSLLE